MENKVFVNIAASVAHIASTSGVEAAGGYLQGRVEGLFEKMQGELEDGEVSQVELTRRLPTISARN